MRTAVKQEPERLEMAEVAKKAGFNERFVRKIAATCWVDFSNDEVLSEAIKLDKEKTVKFLVLLAAGREEHRQLAASYWDTPPQTLVQLACDPKKEIRQAVARNASSPNKALKILASDLDTGILSSVVQNLNAEEDVLEKVLHCPICRSDKKENYGIFSAIAEHPNATAAMLADLATFSCDLIRGAVARNPMAEPHILELLIEKSAFEVSENPGITQKIWERVFQKAMRELEKDENPTMLCNLAKNPSASVFWLDRLARIGDCTVCKDVAENPRTSAETLKYIAENYADRQVIPGVIRHPNTSGETLIFLYNARDSEGALRVILQRKAAKRFQK